MVLLQVLFGFIRDSDGAPVFISFTLTVGRYVDTICWTACCLIDSVYGSNSTDPSASGWTVQQAVYNLLVKQPNSQFVLCLLWSSREFLVEILILAIFWKFRTGTDKALDKLDKASQWGSETIKCRKSWSDIRMLFWLAISAETLWRHSSGEVTTKLRLTRIFVWQRSPNTREESALKMKRKCWKVFDIWTCLLTDKQT